MSLCAPCQDFITNHLHWEVILSGPLDYSPSQAIEKRSPEVFLCSIGYGCYICARIFRNLSEHLQSQLRGLNGQLSRNKRYGGCFAHEIPEPGESRDGFPVVFLGYRMFAAFFSVCFWFGDNFYPCAHFYGRIMNLTGKALSKVLPSWRITSSSTSSEETFTKIDNWLERCDSEHMQCLYHREKRTKGWYPTRLLHVSTFSGHKKRDLKLRIVHGTQLSAGSQYATLSHRWGKENMARLTVDNLSLWTQSIPTKILPQTFLDAVRAARRLGIDYLWIDCLCIIQEGDELADWKQEASTMHSVYSNACFNICASWGPELGGLFATRDPSTVEHASFEMQSKNGWKKKFLLVSSEDGDGTWDELVEHSTLASRGWVFQERLLSPRNIFFCKEIVLYECYEQRWSESMGVDVLHWSPTLNREYSVADIISSPNIKTFLPTGRLTSREELYQAWYDLVEKYSGTELTFAEDRLAAVAGIAQKFIMLLKDKYIENDVYVAGLWLSRLSLDMLWKNLKSMPDPEVHNASPRPTQLTFSWISGYQVKIREPDLEGKELNEEFILPQVTCVKWRTRAHIDPEKYLFDKNITILPSKPCIEVMVRGALKRMILRRGLGMFHVFPVSAIAVPEPEQDWEALKERESEPIVRDTVFVWAGLDFAASKTDISSLNRSKKLFYVPWYDNDDRDGYGLSNTYCLLLELVSHEMGRFRRIGLLRFGPGYRDLYFASQVDEQYYPCWKYDQSTGDHTFFIV